MEHRAPTSCYEHRPACSSGAADKGYGAQMTVGLKNMVVPGINPRWGPAHHLFAPSVFPVTGLGLESTPDLGHAGSSQVNLAISGPPSSLPQFPPSPPEVGRAGTEAAPGSKGE